MIDHTFLSTLDLNRVRDLELAERRYNALRNVGTGVQILVETDHRCWSWIKPEPSELDAFADGLVAAGALDRRAA